MDSPPARSAAGPPAWAWRALILAAPAGLIIRSAAAGEVVGGGDLRLQAFPFWDYLGQSLRHGRVPLWDPDLGAGFPFLASLLTHCVYPPAMLLFALLPLHVGAFAFLFGHLYLAGFGAQRLARRLGYGAGPAACAGALATCAPILSSAINRPNMLAAVAWTPWMLVAAGRIGRRERGGTAALAGCVGLGLLCGQPEVTLLGALLVAGYAGVLALKGDGRALLLCTIGGVLGVGLAAVALLPFAELLGQSARAAELAGMQGAWSLGRGDLANLVLPFVNLDAPQTSFQERFYGPFQQYLSVVYLGAPAALLGAIAVRRGGRREWLLAAVALLAVLLGAYGGELALVLGRLHLGLASWRYPVKFIYPLAFVAALLAARGAEAVAIDAARGRTILGLAIAGAALLLGAAGGLPTLGEPLGVSFAWLGATLLGLAAVWRFVAPGAWRQWALVLLCVLDLGLCSLRAPYPDDSAGCAGLLAAAKPRLGAGRVDASSGIPIPNGLGRMMEEPGWQAHCLHGGNLVAEAGLPSLRYYSIPGLKRNRDIAGRFGSVGDGLFGVTLVLRGHADETVGFVPIAAPELAPLWVAGIPGAAPRVELRAEARVIGDTESALAHETLVQARREVLLDADPPAPSAPGVAYAGPDLAQLVADRGEQVEIDAASAGERYLVLADLYYPGWTASVDGRPAPILAAYGLMRALRLGAGRHRVLFDYRPGSVRLGLWITLLSGAALAMGTLRGRGRVKA